MSAPAASLAWARGMLARLEDRPVTDCPYEFAATDIRAQALGVIWCAAWRHGTEERTPVKHRGPGWARRLVGDKRKGAGRGPGRGRGRLGPRREWDATELMVLALCLEAGWPVGNIARVVERTPQAVWNQINRQGKRVAA